MKFAFPLAMVAVFNLASVISITEAKAQEKPLVPKMAPQLGTRRTMSMSISGGVRTITATEGEEKVEISDKSGKQITLKWTHIVAGKPRTDEFEADDLEALKKKSLEAGAVYEKYSNGFQIPAAGRLVPPAMPIPVPLPFNARRGFPRQALGDEYTDDFEPSRHGPRVVRFDWKEQKFEIFDGPDATIRMKITKVVDGKPKMDEFKAENVYEFRHAHPDLYEIYQKYTGVKAE